MAALRARWLIFQASAYKRNVQSAQPKPQRKPQLFCGKMMLSWSSSILWNIEKLTCNILQHLHGPTSWTYVCHYLNPANWILESKKEHANRQASASTMSEYTNNDTRHLIVFSNTVLNIREPKWQKQPKQKKTQNHSWKIQVCFFFLGLIPQKKKNTFLNAWYLLGTSGILWVQVGRPSEQTWTLTAPTSQTSLGLQWPCSEPSEEVHCAFGPALRLWFTPLTPLELNMEPEHHHFDKEIHLPNLQFRVPC